MNKILQEKNYLAACPFPLVDGQSLFDTAMLNLFGGPMALVPDAIFVKPLNEDELLKVPFSNIDWIEADRSYAHLHLHDKRYVSITGNIGKLELYLPMGMFVRISRSEIVNTRRVQKIIGNILRVGDHNLHVTEKFRKDVLSCFIIFR